MTIEVCFAQVIEILEQKISQNEQNPLLISLRKISLVHCIQYVSLKPWFRDTPKRGGETQVPRSIRPEGSKKHVTERPPESICIIQTNSETKYFSFDFFF